MSYRILIFDTGKEWGGGTVSLLELLKFIDRKKFNFVALFYHNYFKGNKSTIKEELEKLGVEFILLPPKPKTIKIKLLKETLRTLIFFNKNLKKLAIFWIDYFYRIKPTAEEIAKLIKKLNIDLIYMNNQPITNLEGILVSKITHIPAILHCRIEPYLNSFIVKLVNSCLKKIICVSESLRLSLLSHGISKEICTTIYNGIDVKIRPSKSSQEIKEKLKISENELIIGTVCSLVKRKRVEDLIRAFYKVKNNTSKSIKLIIVGDGPERERLINLVQQKNLIQDVIFIGFQDDPISYINIFDIFVLTSEREGFSRVILEAMFLGKPVISSKIVGPLDLVKEGETGFLVPPKNIEEFAKKIQILLENPELRIKMGEKGKKRVLENFTIEQYVRKVEKVFEEVLETQS